MLEPTAFTCVPGASHSRRRIGSCALVQVHTTSAPWSTASAVPPSRRLHDRISTSPSTARIASAWERACTPAPRIATVRAPGRASARVATAETAAVRISVIGEAFRIACNSPVSPSWRRTAPWCASSPRAELPGAITISFSDHVDPSPLLWAGMKPIRLSAPGGRVTNRSGWCSSPRASARRTFSIASMHSSIGSSRRTSCSGMTSTLMRRVRSAAPAPRARAGGRAPRAPGAVARVAAGRPPQPSRSDRRAARRSRARQGKSPRSRARSSNASSASKTRSSWKWRYGSGRSVMRDPAGGSSPRRYFPVSQPPASGLYGV